MVAELDSVSLLAETGLPGHHAFPAEVMRRVFQRLLPSAREESDTGRLLAGLFSSSTAVDRFLGQQRYVFDRLARILWPPDGTASILRLRGDLQQAMSLLAARVAGRGATSAVRQRGGACRVEHSPFYQLVFATETLLRAETPIARSAQSILWRKAVERCSDELEQIHLHMEDAGVSSALVYDLRSIEATLERMQLLGMVYVGGDASARSAPGHEVGSGSVYKLVNTLVRSRLDDVQLRFLVRETLNLLARKTVERTGHGGEHYIAHTRKDYWMMWRAAAGGRSADSLHCSDQDEISRESLSPGYRRIPDRDRLCGQLCVAADIWIRFGD